MTIRFAAARPATTAHFGTRPQRMGAFRAANDNHGGIANAEMLRSALEHFGRHGLAAAERAGAMAEQANAEGDSTSHAHWLEICRAFDRRLADRIEQAPASEMRSGI